MSKAVELEDSEVAVELVQFAYFKKVGLAEEEKLMVLVTEYSGLSDVIVWGFLCRSWRKRRNARGRRRTLGTRRRTRRKSHRPPSARREPQGRGRH